MKKVGDFIMSPQIGQMKQDSLLSLSKEKHIQSFFKENHIEASLMNEYWVYPSQEETPEGIEKVENSRYWKKNEI